MILMIEKLTGTALEKQLRSLHPSPQAADREMEILCLMWTYESSNPPSVTYRLNKAITSNPSSMV